MVSSPFLLWQRVTTVDMSLWLDVVLRDHPAGGRVQGVQQESHLVPGWRRRLGLCWVLNCWSATNEQKFLLGCGREKSTAGQVPSRTGVCKLHEQRNRLALVLYFWGVFRLHVTSAAIFVDVLQFKYSVPFLVELERYVRKHVPNLRPAGQMWPVRASKGRDCLNPIPSYTDQKCLHCIRRAAWKPLCTLLHYMRHSAARSSLNSCIAGLLKNSGTLACIWRELWNNTRIKIEYRK